ncbi:MAG: hypothetical protein Q8922_01925 [Bacteroidota bacterium]|nr:hypothetical protein [Bacteroidota bacterium]MDP4232014.1 hypothetical protein [Bacteroidota bacterium]MDP4241279.1 hypothetical protein [Bacteroidota bacterium]MDP4286671.1 hypothetical protein [Bacteroidota bacterium]
MSKKNERWLASICGTTLALSSVLPILAGCDRGASDEIGAARKFSEAVVRNDQTGRDSMIATAKFKEYFDNAYVGHDMRIWFGTFYDYKEGHFSGTSSADVERDLKPDLQGALIDTTEIEETGMVKVKPKDPSEDAAFFWMVHQRGKPWRVAVVTKGETKVNFK